MQELRAQRNASTILALDTGEQDFGMGNFVKKNIKFGVMSAFQNQDALKMQFANPNTRKGPSEIDSQIDPISMCIKNLNKSSSLYVEEKLAENKIMDF